VTEEDFIAWRDNPVTQWVMEAYRISAAMCEQEWTTASWQFGNANQRTLDELRNKAMTFASIYEATFDDIQARHDEQH
jgi:hypothetical protein